MKRGCDGDSSGDEWLNNLCQEEHLKKRGCDGDSSGDEWLHNLCQEEHLKKLRTLAPTPAPAPAPAPLEVAPLEVAPLEVATLIAPAPLEVAALHAQPLQVSAAVVLARALPVVAPVLEANNLLAASTAEGSHRDSWKRFLSQGALAFEDVVPLMTLLHGKPYVHIAICRNRLATAGVILEHCCCTIAAYIGVGPTVFKVGITGNPVHRWENPEWGYARELDRWQKLVILDVNGEVGHSAMLEAALIRHFKMTHGSPNGFRNERSGGDNPPCSGPCYTYLVFRRLH